jgi:hypothetical protein
MNKLFLLLILVALILSACGTATSNPDGYYNVTLKAGGMMTCNHISWTGNYLHCDNHWPISREKVWDVYFVAGAK